MLNYLLISVFLDVMNYCCRCYVCCVTINDVSFVHYLHHVVGYYSARWLWPAPSVSRDLCSAVLFIVCLFYDVKIRIVPIVYDSVGIWC